MHKNVYQIFFLYFRSYSAFSVVDYGIIFVNNHEQAIAQTLPYLRTYILYNTCKISFVCYIIVMSLYNNYICADCGSDFINNPFMFYVK